MKPNLPSGAKAKQDKADKSRDNDTKPLTNPTKPKEIPQTQDDGLVQVSSNSDEDDYNDMNHESSYQRQNFHYKNYSHRKYRPFTKAEASNQTVILPILLEAIKDGSAANSRFPPHNEDNRRFESAPYRESTRKFENCSNPDRLSPIIGNFKNRFNSRHHHYKQFHRGSSYRNDASFRTSRSCEEEDDRDKGRNSANRSLSPTFESTKDSVVIDEIGKTPTQKESEGDATLNDVNLEDKLEVQPSEFDSLKITHTIEIDPRILLKYSTSSNQDSKKLTDESIKKENSSEVGVKTSNEKKKLNSKEEDAIAANYSKREEKT
ncbi:hypothetical protein QE152_g1561 [Popillia japonica]|uniref:Uncharacterized protein n=1 Tax=Popillia japonica TaxID=7064 RepID=A0AAW1N9M9_POPJA